MTSAAVPIREEHQDPGCACRHLSLASCCRALPHRLSQLYFACAASIAVRGNHWNPPLQMASRRMSLLPLHRAKQAKSDNSFFLSNRTKSLERMTGGRCLRVRMMNRHRQRVARAPIPEVDVVYACQSAPPVSGWRRLAIRLPIYGGRCVGALCPPVHRLRYWNHASSATLCGWRLCSA